MSAASADNARPSTRIGNAIAVRSFIASFSFQNFEHTAMLSCRLARRDCQSGLLAQQFVQLVGGLEFLLEILAGKMSAQSVGDERRWLSLRRPRSEDGACRASPRAKLMYYPRRLS